MFTCITTTQRKKASELSERIPLTPNNPVPNSWTGRSSWTLCHIHAVDGKMMHRRSCALRVSHKHSALATPRKQTSEHATAQQICYMLMRMLRRIFSPQADIIESLEQWRACRSGFVCARLRVKGVIRGKAASRRSACGSIVGMTSGKVERRVRGRRPMWRPHRTNAHILSHRHCVCRVLGCLV